MGWRPPLPKVAAFGFPSPSKTRNESAGVILLHSPIGKRFSEAELKHAPAARPEHRDRPVPGTLWSRRRVLLAQPADLAAVVIHGPVGEMGEGGGALQAGRAKGEGHAHESFRRSRMDRDRA